MRKFFWVVILSLVLLVVAVGNFLFYRYIVNATFEEIRQNLMVIAANATLGIDADVLMKVPLNAEGMKTQEYSLIAEQLTRIKKINPRVKYVYTMTATSQPGIVQYIVDANPLPQKTTVRSPTSFPGDRYDARNVPALLSAYNGPAADRHISTDAWGSFLSGYAPIYNDAGNVVALLGIDFDAAEVSMMQKKDRVWIFFVFAMGVFVVAVVVRFMLKVVG